MLLVSALITASCLATPKFTLEQVAPEQPELTLEQVAPEQTVIAISLDDMGSILERLKTSPAGEHLEDLEDMKEPLLDVMPDSVSDAWDEALEEKSLVEILGSIRMGIAMYPDVDQETTAVTLGLTMYMGLGDAGEAIGPMWDEAMERLEESGEGNFELIDIAETEVIRIDVGEDEEEAEEENPFGGGGGFGMGMSPEDMRPKRFYIVRADDNILVSTSRTQMERMLDLAAGRDVDGGLGESDVWQGIDGYLDEGGLRIVVLTDHLGEMMQGIGQPFLINMMKPMIIAMFGRIDAMGMAIQAAPEPALATFQLGMWMPAGKTGLMKLLSRNSPREPIPGWISADTTSYGRINFDTEGVLPWIKDIINSNPLLAMQAGQIMEQVEPMLQKVLAGMGDTIRMSTSISYPLTAESSNSLWAVDARDAKVFTDALSEIAPQMGFEPRDFQGHQVYSVDMGGMIPGMSGPGEIGVAVGGGQIFMGTLPAVEQALRAVGQRASEDSSLATKFAALDRYFTSDPIAMWSVSDLGSSFAANADIAEMQWKSELGQLEDEDPELAAELSEMMGDDDSPMFENLADWIGLSAYEVLSVENGFRGRGWILAPTED